MDEWEKLKIFLNSLCWGPVHLLSSRKQDVGNHTKSCLVIYLCLQNYEALPTLTFQQWCPEVWFFRNESERVNLSTFSDLISQRNVCFPLEDSWALSTSKPRPLSRTECGTFSQCTFCSFEDTGLHTCKMLGMKYGWPKNVLVFFPSWPHYWGQSKGQNLCFSSPIPYPSHLFKLCERFWRGQKVAER